LPIPVYVYQMQERICMDGMGISVTMVLSGKKPSQIGQTRPLPTEI
jgi:hypothetical protein